MPPLERALALQTDARGPPHQTQSERDPRPWGGAVAAVERLVCLKLDDSLAQRRRGYNDPTMGTQGDCLLAVR